MANITKPMLHRVLYGHTVFRCHRPCLGLDKGLSFTSSFSSSSSSSSFCPSSSSSSPFYPFSPSSSSSSSSSLPSYQVNNKLYCHQKLLSSSSSSSSSSFQIKKNIYCQQRLLSSSSSSSSLFQVNNKINCQQRLSSSSTRHPYIPRRSVLYVPAHDKKKMLKIPNLNTDCAVLECEDGVALNKKGEARENICEILEQVDFGFTDCAVRVNSVSSGLMEEDLRVILQAKNLPQTILLPKVNTVDELTVFTESLAKEVRKRGREVGYQPCLIVFIESGEAVMNMRHVLQQAVKYSHDGLYTIDGVVFGSDDYCADIGANRTSDAMEVMYARQKIVMTAKSFRLQAIDMVSIDIQDVEALRKQSEEGARMGFTGKQIIHPSQVAIVNAAFTPSEERVGWARELIDAFNHHQATGEGAFTFRGNMIDMPLLLQAKNIVKLLDNIQKR